MKRVVLLCLAAAASAPQPATAAWRQDAPEPAPQPSAEDPIPGDEEEPPIARACSVPYGQTMPLVACGDTLQTFVWGSLAISEDAGRHWRIERPQDECNSTPLDIWRLPAKADRLCASFAMGYEEPGEEHRCTEDGGKTWEVIIASDAQWHTYDVLAKPDNARRLVAIKAETGGETTWLQASNDGGRTWDPVMAGRNVSMSIPGAVGKERFLLLEGDAAGYNRLALMSFGNGAGRTIEGPWTGARSAQITQAVVNPLKTDQWVVSVWFAEQAREITYLTYDRGDVFHPIEVPEAAVWPIEFVSNHAKLLVNLRHNHTSGRDQDCAQQAALYSPKKAAWTPFNLPDASGEAMARGGHVYVNNFTGLSRLKKVTREGAQWEQLEISPEYPVPDDGYPPAEDDDPML